MLATQAGAAAREDALEARRCHAQAVDGDEQVAGGLGLVLALVVLTGGAIGVGVLFDMVDRDRGIARWDGTAWRDVVAPVRIKW